MNAMDILMDEFIRCRARGDACPDPRLLPTWSEVEAEKRAALRLEVNDPKLEEPADE